MVLLRHNQDDHLALLTAASEEQKIPFEFVEKDYWVTELLRSVAKPIENATPVFKGGTSLSKCYKLTQRFSEDVDIVLEIARPSGGKLGKGTIDNILSSVCERAAADLGIDSEPVRSGKGEHRAVRYVYPVKSAVVTLSRGVSLEIGVRGITKPRRAVQMRSYASEYVITAKKADSAEFEDLVPVEVYALSPERTLVEKLALLHDLSSRFPQSKDRMVQVAGRHVYDVYKCLSNEEVIAVLQHANLVATLATQTDEESKKWGFSSTPRPVGGYAESPAFDKGHPCHATIRESLEAARTLIYGARPTPEECIAAVKQRSALL